MGLVFPRAENDRESSVTFRTRSPVSHEKGAPWATTTRASLQPIAGELDLAGASAAAPTWCPAGRGMKHREAGRTWSEGPGSSLCCRFSKICQSAIAPEITGLRLHQHGEPSKVLAERDFIAFVPKRAKRRKC